jgi:hypothetical protein
MTTTKLPLYKQQAIFLLRTNGITFRNYPSKDRECKNVSGSYNIFVFEENGFFFTIRRGKLPDNIFPEEGDRPRILLLTGESNCGK